MARPTVSSSRKAIFVRTETGKVAATTADGKIVVAGTTSGSGPDSSVVVARWGADGKLDAKLAGTGKTTVPAIEDPETVLPLPHGRLLVVGSASAGEGGTVVVRLKEDGDLDSSYGDDGVARADFIASNAPVGAGLQADGKLVVAPRRTTSTCSARRASRRRVSSTRPTARAGS